MRAWRRTLIPRWWTGSLLEKLMDTIFLSDEQVLARQSWVGCFGQRISVNKGVEAGTE